MAIRYSCDLCGREIQTEEHFYAGKHLIGGRMYCKTCWLNPQNWPLIHKEEKKKQ